VAIIAGIMVAWLISGTAVDMATWTALVLLAGVSLVDDIGGAPVLLRLAAHLAGSVIVLGSAMGEMGLLMILALSLAIVWVTNLYNFMDGSDGLAGGMAVLGFSSYGLAAWFNGDATLAAESAAIAAAAAGFLPFNFHPARIFMGDVGAIPLGFLAAILGIHGWWSGTWSLWFPVLGFSPFLVDATVTLARRALQRRKVWEAHHDHYYQRLVRMGWSHRRLALYEYVLMAGTGLSALLMRDLDIVLQWTALAAWAVIYLAAMAAVDRYWKHFLDGQALK